MKNIILTSILLGSIVSNTSAQSQFEPRQSSFEEYQTTSPSRKLRLNEIKAKLNRLKSRRSNRTPQNTQFKSNTSVDPRSSSFHQQSPQSFEGSRTQNQQMNPHQRTTRRSNNNTQHRSFQSDGHHNIQRPITNTQSSNLRDTRRAFSKRNSNRQDAYDTALVRSCENAGKDLTLRGNQGEKARNFYAQRCDQLISKISIEHRLDSLLDLQGKYLSLQGRHQEANRFITLAYQQAPNALDTNIALIKNLVSLGQASMAEDMLLFYIGEKGVQNLNPREHKSLKTLHQQLKRMQ